MSCCTLAQLFRDIVNESDVAAQASQIDSFLHTYRLFTDASTVLRTIDDTFWCLCNSESLDVNQKLRAINSLRLMLSRWLQPPHVRDFTTTSTTTSCDSNRLHPLLRVMVRWRGILRPNSLTTGTTDPDWTTRFMDDSPLSKCHLFVRCMFYEADQERLDRIVKKLDLLCQYALSLEAKILRSPLNPTQVPDPTQSKSVHSEASHGRGLSAPPDSRSVDVRELKPHRIAEELTLRDQQLFLDVCLPECLLYVRKQPSPSVQATINHFNQIVNAVQGSILRIPRGSLHSSRDIPLCNPKHTDLDGYNSLVTTIPKIRSRRRNGFSDDSHIDASLEHFNAQRARVIALWIDVASSLDKLNSLSSLQAVLTALQTNAIHRLRMCWGIVERLYVSHVANFEALTSLMSSEKNYEKLRARISDHMETLRSAEVFKRKVGRLNKVKPFANNNPPVSPCESPTSQRVPRMRGMIPYMGMYFQDLTFLHCAFPDRPAQPPLSSDGSTHSTPQMDSNSAPIRPKLYQNIVASTNSLPESFGTYPSVGDRRTNRRQLSSRTRHPACSTPLTPEVPLCSRSPSPHPPDAASQSGKLINFGKHMREAEFLRDLYLLQYSAKQYIIRPYLTGRSWINSFPPLSESEAWQLSLEIEPSELTLVPGTSNPSAIRGSLPTVGSTDTLSNYMHHCGSSNAASKELVIERYRRPSVPSVHAHLMTDHASKNAPCITSTGRTDYRLVSPTVKIIVASHPEINSDVSQSEDTNVVNSQNDTFMQLTVPRNRSARSVSPRRGTHSRTPSRSTRTLLIHVVLEDPEYSVPDASSTSNFLKQVAKLGSMPNLVMSSSMSVTERVSETDRISDVLPRVLIKFGLPLLDVTKYDLIRIQPGMPDRLLPADTNAFTALVASLPRTGGHGDVDPVDINEPIQCACVRRVKHVTATSTSVGSRPRTPLIHSGHRYPDHAPQRHDHTRSSFRSLDS